MVVEIFKFENRTSDGEFFLPIGRDDSPVYFVLYGFHQQGRSREERLSWWYKYIVPELVEWRKQEMNFNSEPFKLLIEEPDMSPCPLPLTQVMLKQVKPGFTNYQPRRHLNFKVTGT